MSKAQFIVVEGLEGAGKSTAIKAIESLLTSHGISFINTREPGGTPLAEQIRSLVKHGYQSEIPSESTELLLMYAARTQLVDTVIKPALAEGKWVIGDRHDLSSQAYQGGGRELGESKLSAMRKLALGEFKPDLTLYLDIEPELGLSRARARGELDRIEQQALSFFERARAVYLEACEQDASVHKIDASQSIEQVAAAIQTKLVEFIEQA